MRNYIGMNNDKVIAKAYQRSCEFLGLDSEKVFKSYKVNDISDLTEREKVKREVSLKIISIYRNLTAIVNDNSKVWMNSINIYFNAVPVEVIYAGQLDKVAGYLENALGN